jgi:transcriptional regulator with XRE-family HTH domain
MLVRLAIRLYLLRTSLRLTQQELAARTGLDQASISDIENGDANPTVRTIGRIASGLGIDAGALFSPDSIGLRLGSTLHLNKDVKWRGYAPVKEPVAARPKRQDWTRAAKSGQDWAQGRYKVVHVKEETILENNELKAKVG